ncbi:ABC transporter ATP-binding protein [uncultured Desulfobulbus sp.]|uniref:ABC transporter ATP-binding protein n=1 Tax=uncultured Desulfobulbus sp. TaxID=239745 RepID=UPI0029C633C6|nr:ABC transporter ATP-binding protein [uncultured Desulfobulbus sp.]
MRSNQWAIRAEGTSKKFGLTLRQSMKYGLRDVARKLAGRSSTSGVLREGEFWAVDNVSFELRSGEALGIMGVNGCGKTTLLRILNGVYSPDAGRIQIRGRVGALIAAGAGFAPMLSGRENVYVNGALLGLTTKEIDGLMDEIIAFSELDHFIDLPVKNYSSGMYVRLGFAIAALSRPDVLLMDEVLAVGDLNFQKKCFDHILQLKSEGTAIILVSHSIGAIWSVCDRGLFMDHGKVLREGSVEDVIRAYDDQNSRNALVSEGQFALAAEEHEDDQIKAQEEDFLDALKTDTLPAEYGHSRGGTGDAQCVSVRVLSDESGEEINSIVFGTPLLIECRYKVINKIDEPIFRFSIDAVHYKFLVSLDSYEQGMQLESIEPGDYLLRVRVNDQNFRPGMYRINTSIARRQLGVHIFYWLSAASFIVTHPNNRFLYSNDKAVFFLPCDFVMEQIA